MASDARATLGGKAAAAAADESAEPKPWLATTLTITFAAAAVLLASLLAVMTGLV